MKYFLLNAVDIAAKKGISVAEAETMLPIRPSVKTLGVLGDCGVDLFAPYPFTVQSGTYKIVDTFLGFKLEPGIGALVWPRGGDVHLIGSGVIDTGYSGSIKVKVVNPYSSDLSFERGDSLGQLVPFVKAYLDGIELEETESGWQNSERGQQGRINQ